MSTIEWAVSVSGTPKLLRYCKKCGEKRHFLSSERFRINAQQSKLDIWLIYRCEKCDCTFNLEIHSKISPHSLPASRYERYLNNDASLARNVCL